MRIDPMRVLLAGVLSPTGQLVARSLSSSSDYKVTVLCSSSIGGAILDDSGPLSETAISPAGVGGGVTGVLVDALVIATDEPPPVSALERLFEACEDVQHTILLSRLGGSTGAAGVAAWKDLESAATECCPSLTIVRLGEPLLGGPFHATDIDLIRWKTAGTPHRGSTISAAPNGTNPNVRARAVTGVADTMLAAEVATGDTLKQSGFGASRLVAASAIASVLRRGPEQQSSYSVACTSDGAPTTAEQYDDLFTSAAGGATAAAVSADEGVAAASEPARVTLDLGDALLEPFTKPYEPPPPSPLEVLKANFFGNPAVAGPNWLTLVFLVGGLYQCTRPEYIAEKGIDVFGLAPKYGIELKRTQYGSMNELPQVPSLFPKS